MLHLLSCRVACRIWVPVAIAVFGTPTFAGAQTSQSFDDGWRAGTPVTVTGVVTALYLDDFENRRSDVVHAIRDQKTGRSFTLRFDKAQSRLRPGTVTTVTGRARGSEVYLLADQLASTSTASSTATSVQAATVTGDQRTLVIVANLLDATVPTSTAAINDLMFSDPQGRSVDRLYREMSAGQVSFSGTVVGPYLLNRSSTDPCDLGALTSAAETAAGQAVDLSTYPRKVYVLPPAGCGAAGLAEFGATPSRAWVFYSEIGDIFAHELGHNLGMHHASTASNEYGDNTSIMGLARNRLRPVNAPHKIQMGWASGTQVVSAERDGDFELAPLELQPGVTAAPQVLVVPKAGTTERYYVAYRRAIGINSEGYAEYMDRLSVHLWSGGTTQTFFLAALADGETFTDPATGFSVTQVSHTDMAATARVSLGVSCAPRAPSVILTPRDQSGPAGGSATYDVALVNTDGIDCGAATFALSSVVPSGWAGSLAPSSLVLAPGATGHAVWTVSAPAGAPQGLQTIVVGVSDPAVGAHNASATGSYTILPVCANAPELIFAPASQTGPPGSRLDYSVSVVNRDEAGCPTISLTVSAAVPSGWAATLSSTALTLAPGTSAVVGYSVTSSPQATAGTYANWARVVDDRGTHTAAAAGSYNVDTSDTTPPSVPEGLTAVVKRSYVSLSWQASTDNLTVAGYRVYRDGVLVALVAGTSWVDVSATSGTYTYVVTAYDAAGNVSGPSSSATVTYKRPKGRQS